MKLSKKLLSLLLCAMMIFGSCAAGGEGFAGVLDLLNIKANSLGIWAFPAGDGTYGGDPFYQDEAGWPILNSEVGFGYESGYKFPKDRYTSVYNKIDANYVYLTKNTSWGGNCFGMSLTSAMHWYNRSFIKKYAPSGNSPYDYPYLIDIGYTSFNPNSPIPYRISKGSKLCKIIELAQVSQWTKGIADCRIECKDKNAFEYIIDNTGTIQDSDGTWFYYNKEPLVIALEGKDGGHAVVLDANGGVNYVDGLYKIWIYDPNYPGLPIDGDWNEDKLNELANGYNHVMPQCILYNPETKEWKLEFGELFRDWQKSKKVDVYDFETINEDIFTSKNQKIIFSEFVFGCKAEYGEIYEVDQQTKKETKIADIVDGSITNYDDSLFSVSNCFGESLLKSEKEISKIIIKNSSGGQFELFSDNSRVFAEKDCPGDITLSASENDASAEMNVSAEEKHRAVLQTDIGNSEKTIVISDVAETSDNLHIDFSKTGDLNIDSENKSNTINLSYIGSSTYFSKFEKEITISECNEYSNIDTLIEDNPDCLNIAVLESPNGTVSKICNPEDSSLLTLKAIPNNGYMFWGWLNYEGKTIFSSLRELSVPNDEKLTLKPLFYKPAKYVNISAINDNNVILNVSNYDDSISKYPSKIKNDNYTTYKISTDTIKDENGITLIVNGNNNSNSLRSFLFELEDEDGCIISKTVLNFLVQPNESAFIITAVDLSAEVVIFEGALNSREEFEEFCNDSSILKKLRAIGYADAEYDYDNALSDEFLDHYSQIFKSDTASQPGDISYGDYLSASSRFDSSWYMANGNIHYMGEEFSDPNLLKYYIGSADSIGCFADKLNEFISFTVPIEKNVLNKNQKIKYNSSAFICLISDEMFDDDSYYDYDFEWYVNGVLAEDTDNIYVDEGYLCLKDLKEDVNIRYKVSDDFGNTIYDSGEIKLDVRNSFFDKIIYFFKSLFGYTGEVFVACKSEKISEWEDLAWYTTEKDGKEEFNEDFF